MKKVLLIISTVLVLIVATYFADKATRVKATGPAKYIEQANSKIDDKLAPEVKFRDLDGKDVTLAQYKGTVVLVDFWATWCEPCYVEIPWLIEMQQKYAAKGFTGSSKCSRSTPRRDSQSLEWPWMRKANPL